MGYQITRPDADQVKITSAKTGEWVLEDYIEAAEIGNKTLAQLLNQVFNSSGVPWATMSADSAASALSYLNAFKSQYYGPMASAPATDPLGAAISTGDMYWDTTSSTMMIYTGSAWVPVGVATPVTVTLQQFSGNGSQTNFTLSQAPSTQNACEVFISGVAQVPVADYTVSGTTLTFTSPPPVGTSNIFARITSTVSIGTPADGTVTQAKMDDTYASTLAKLNAAQQFTARQRTTPLTDNDLSFDLAAANDFVCTPTAGGTLTFTNITAGCKGEIILVNNSNYTIAKAAAVKCPSSMLTTISTTGRYRLAYSSLDGVSVDVTSSAALA